jgi:CRP/FNR family cyclic AMP-dependent transcriptional regulator
MHTFTLFNHEKNTVAVREGEIIFEQGAAADCMYAVIEGEIEIVRDGAVLEVVGAGGVFGEMGLLDHAPRSATARAKLDSTLAAISDKRFTVLVSQNPPFALGMMRVLAERVRRNLAS